MPAEVVPFTTAQFAPSATPPTSFAHGVAPSVTPPASFAHGVPESTTPPAAFGADSVTLANIAALKAIAASEELEGTVRLVAPAIAGGVPTAWRYVLGEHADDVANGFAQPDDYDEEENAGYWQRVDAASFTAGGYTPSVTAPASFAHGVAASATPPTAFGSEAEVLPNVTALKAIATSAALANAVRQVTSSTPGESVQAWQYLLGAHADDVANGFAQPDDYDAEENAGYWVRVL